MKRTNIIIPIVAVVVLVGLMVFDCNRRTSTQLAPSTTLRGEVLGTFYQITAKGSLSESFPERLDSLLGVINRSMSIFDKGSLLSRINRGDCDWRLTPEERSELLYRWMRESVKDDEGILRNKYGEDF